MMYNVISMLPVGQTTSVTIEGNGDGLKNNMRITDSKGVTYELMSVGMTSDRDARDTMKTTSILIKGKFNSESIII